MCTKELKVGCRKEELFSGDGDADSVYKATVVWEGRQAASKATTSLGKQHRFKSPKLSCPLSY